MSSGPDIRAGILRNKRPDYQNSTLTSRATIHDLDLDRRSLLRDERYGTTSTYMSEHQTGTVFIRVSVAELKVQKCLQFELDETVWEAKQRILSIFSKDLRDSLNYGLYMPPMNGRAGKFLDEERLLREYPLHGPIGFLEFKYKRRVYKLIHLNARKLKQLHNKTNFRQFIEHVKNGNLSKIHKLTNKGLDPNFHDSASGETPLTLATSLTKEKCREVIISLVSGGAHLDFRTRQGQTPMHKAVLNGNQSAVKTLLDLGASTNYKDSRGLTPLYYSILYGKNAIVTEMLLHERASIGVQDEQGQYEIHQACRLGLVQHLEHLMFYGADLDVQNASGNTGLHICAVNNNEQCARILLFRGANKSVPNYNNQTPQQVAILAGNMDLAETIKSFEDGDIVLFREMPTFSARRSQMFSSTLSLLSRSRSDPKLNISCAIDNNVDPNVTSLPASMRNLPKGFQMNSDSGSYPASRDSDSMRSMSVSSSSSGNVMSVTDAEFWEGSSNNREGWFPANHVQEVRLRDKAMSMEDLLSNSRQNTLERNTLAALIKSDFSDYGPRTVVLQRASAGYGFVLRGAKSQLKPSGELDFRPTPEFPALQYLDSVDPGSVSDKAGLKAGDFILEINGENVVRASHDRVVHLIRGTGDTLAMKVVTVKPGNRSQDWFQEDKSLTMPNRKKKAAPAPPQRDPRTSLSMSKSEGQSMSEELAVMETLDKAIYERKNSEETNKTASIRSRTAAKRVSCVELENIGVTQSLERSKSTPDLLDGNSKLYKDIYATPAVPDKGHVYAVPNVVTPGSPTKTSIRPKGPPPAPPSETGSPKKQAPKPPQTEVISIDTRAQSQYATSKISVSKDKNTDTLKQSSFRPVSDDYSSERSFGSTSGHRHTSSNGSAVITTTAEIEQKQGVSFAEDKVFDSAASFLKKHPNAKLLITTQGQPKLRNTNSVLFEPEPDYDITDDNDAQGPSSPIRKQDNRQSVTVISVGDKKESSPAQSKRYTIHSTIPADERTNPGHVIPPRPNGPAPSPPRQVRKSAAPPPPTTKVHQDPETPPPLPDTPPPDFDKSPLPDVHKENEPVQTEPSSQAPVPAPPPPPPPPVPSLQELEKTKSDLKPEITPIPFTDIAAAVAKRQERIEKEGLKFTSQTGKQIDKPQNALETNQAAILAAVEKRRKQLEQKSESSVVDEIESRLQKTKKLQAAKFNIAGAKVIKKSDDNKATKPETVITNATVKVGESKLNKITNKTDVIKPNPPVVKEDNVSKPKELSFTIKPAKSVKSSGLTEIKPKIVSTKTETKQVNGASQSEKTNSVVSKPQQLESKVESTSEVKEDKSTNGQSDFLALAEKKRQEYLSRKSKSPPGSKVTTPRSSTASTPDKDIFRTKKIEIKPVEKQGGSPPVSAKPKIIKGATTNQSYTEYQSSKGPVKVRPVSALNGDSNKNGDQSKNFSNAPPPPFEFQDGRHVENTVVQLEIIPPPPSFTMENGPTETHSQHSPAFSPDTASVVSSLSTLSSLSGDHDGRGSYEDLIAPPPPGFDDGDAVVIPPPPEFGNENKNNKTSGKSFNDKPVEIWLCNDVLDWLDSLNMSQYKNSFQQNCVDGKKLLSLTRNNYIELGVTQVGHRMSIERSIKKAAIKQSSPNIIASEHL